MKKITVLIKSSPIRERIVRMLGGMCSACQISVVDSMSMFWTDFKMFPPDIIVLSLESLSMTELEVLQELKMLNFQIPFIGLVNSDEGLLKRLYLDGGLDYVLEGAEDFRTIPEIINNHIFPN